jgi:ppGpp synthetase/RelA/SpoT-type nucleotidyltranferase
VASIEHKRFSKCDGHVPELLADELRLAAGDSRTLDERMQRLRAAAITCAPRVGTR